MANVVNFLLNSHKQNNNYSASGDIILPATALAAATYGDDRYTSLSTCPILPTKFLFVVDIALSPAANIPACPPQQGPHVGVDTAPPASIIVSKYPALRASKYIC